MNIRIIMYLLITLWTRKSHVYNKTNTTFDTYEYCTQYSWQRLAIQMHRHDV